MGKSITIKNCPKCKSELGIVNVRYASKNHTMKKIVGFYYCEKCKKFLKLKEVFDEM